MEMWSEIRRRVLTGELTKRAACREYDLHWETLEKILRMSSRRGIAGRSRVTSRRSSRFCRLLRRSSSPIGRRRKSSVIRRSGFGSGCVTSMGLPASRRSSRMRCGPGGMVRPRSLPALSHRPGEAQVDFGFAQVKLNGQATKVALFVMTLPYSDALVIQVFPRECTEAFLEGHQRAFAFFGGVPRRISYDNSKIAVAKITGSRQREVTKEFLRLKSHFLFQDHFCLVRRPNEKGHVERLLDFARTNYLVPVPEVASLVELNAALLQRCQADLDRQLYGKSAPKAVLLEEERPALLPIPPPGVRGPASEAGVGQLVVVGAVRHEQLLGPGEVRPSEGSGGRHGRRDSAGPRGSADRPASAALGTGEVPVRAGPLPGSLGTEAGGFDFARPLENWNLPSCFETLRRRLEREPNGLGMREFIRVLRLLEHSNLPQLTDAVEYALDLDITDADSIRVILEHRREQPVPLFSLDGRPHLKGVTVEPTDVSAYQSLLVEG